MWGALVGLATWSPGPWSPLLVFCIKLLKNYNVHGLVLLVLCSMVRCRRRARVTFGVVVVVVVVVRVVL